VSAACVRSCTIARRHVAECEHPDDGTCRGCLPRPADFGALCIACHYALVRALHDLPHARTLLAGHLQPSYARRDNQVKATKGNPPVPLNLGVLDLGLEFDHIPMAWARIHAEEHDLAAPADAVAHLRIHLASVECAEWIADAWDELTALVSHAHSLVPWRAEARRMHAPCPHCHCQALVIYGGDEHVTCQECGGVIAADQYAHWVRVVLEERTAAA
jgi:ribosomal protein S27E